MKILIGILSLFLVITIIPSVFADIPFDDYAKQIIKIKVGTNGNAHVIHEISPFDGSAKLEFLDGAHSNFDIDCKLSCPFEFDDTDQIFEESKYMVFKQFPAFQNSLIIEYDLENVLELSNGLWKFEISSNVEPEFYFDDSIELIFINSTPVDISDIPGIHCKGGGCYMILEFFDPDEMNSTILFESDISIQSNDKISNFKINEEGYSITFDTNKENQLLLISIPNNLIANKINIYSSVIGTEPTNNDKLKLSTIEYDNLVKFYVKPNNIGTILITNLDIDVSKIQSPEGGGCLIATAAYGSEMAPQVQFLREIRDNTVLQTQSGTSFMTVFNSFYYTFSPAVADYERENPVFKEAVKVGLTPLLTSLTILNYVEIDTEQEMLGYGIGIIMLNIGMYFVAPAVVIIALKKRIK